MTSTLSSEHAVPVPGCPPEPTPVLRVDLATVAASYDALARALPRVDLHYAVKANPAPAVLSTLAARGCRWDVASLGELEAVLAVDPDPGHVSFGNTVKRDSDIRRANARGVRRFALDCRAELEKLTAAAPGATLLVRLATSGAGADWALGQKFGCDEATAGALLLTAARRGHPVGVCFHVGSQQRDVTAWDDPLAATARLRARLRAAGHDLAVVDLGGGFPALTADPSPPIWAFGERIARALHVHLGPRPPALMAEPGRFLVADAGVLETEVLLVCERGGGRRWAYVDAGVFSGLMETVGEAIRYRVTAHRDGETLAGPVGPVALAGPTCDSVDVMYDERPVLLPTGLRIGDRLRLHGTGAYTTTYSSVGFNGFPPLREVQR